MTSLLEGVITVRHRRRRARARRAGRGRRQDRHHQRRSRRVVRRLRAAAADRGVGRLRRQRAARPQRRRRPRCRSGPTSCARRWSSTPSRSSRCRAAWPFADVDVATGQLANRFCPVIARETFLVGHRAAALPGARRHRRSDHRLVAPRARLVAPMSTPRHALAASTLAGSPLVGCSLRRRDRRCAPSTPAPPPSRPFGSRRGAPPGTASRTTAGARPAASASTCTR